MVARAAAIDSSVQNLVDSGKLNKNQLITPRYSVCTTAALVAVSRSSKCAKCTWCLARRGAGAPSPFTLTPLRLGCCPGLFEQYGASRRLDYRHRRQQLPQ